MSSLASFAALGALADLVDLTGLADLAVPVGLADLVGRAALPVLVVGSLDAAVVVGLLAVGFLAGVGITALGPGGVFVTIALAATIGSPAVVAGTAGATNIAAGIVGSLVYARSGELRSRAGRRMAVALSLPGAAGALLGVRLNRAVSPAGFERLLGAVVALAGVLVWYRARYGTRERSIDADSRRGLLVVGAVGFAVGVPGGLLGVGGPVLAVPVLVALGSTLLPTLAAAQVQSVAIAGSATAGYLVREAVSLPLLVIVGVPELVGILVGWKVARVVDAKHLKRALAGVLVGLGPYIAL